MLYVMGISREELEELAVAEIPPGTALTIDHTLFEAGIREGKALLARQILEGCCGELDKVK
jgi:hypothetical protein